MRPRWEGHNQVVVDYVYTNLLVDNTSLTIKSYPRMIILNEWNTKEFGQSHAVSRPHHLDSVKAMPIDGINPLIYLLILVIKSNSTHHVIIEIIW